MYRVYDAGDRLIYVGSTTNLSRRMYRGHSHFSWWFDLVARVESESFPSRYDAYASEAVAIQEEQPAFNIVNTGRDGEFDHLTDDDLAACRNWLDRAPSYAANKMPSSLRRVVRERASLLAA